MIKVEDIQTYGKEHLESVAASASNMQSGVQAIATAYGDYAKKSFEDSKSFVEKLSGVKSLDKALEAQTEYARSASGVPRGVDSPELLRPIPGRLRWAVVIFVISVIGDIFISSARSNVISEGGRSWDVVADAGGAIVRRLRRC